MAELGRMEVLRLKMTELRPFEDNPRTIGGKAMTGLEKSIKRFGLVEPIVWNKKTGNIVGGHQRYRVLVEEGVEETDVIVVDLPQDEEVALNVALNNPAIQGKFTDDLQDRLQEIQETFGQQLYSEMLFDALEDGKGATRQRGRDVVPDVPPEPVSKQGSLYHLGPHRLLCADSRDIASFKRLLGDEKIKLAVTSPPYGVGKEYEEKGLEPWFDTVKPVIANLVKSAQIVVWELIDIYATGGSRVEPTAAFSVNMFLEHGSQMIWTRIWQKESLNFGIGPYHLSSNKAAQQYEYIMAFAAEHGGEYVEDGVPLINTSDYQLMVAFADPEYKFRFKYAKRLSKKERREWGYAGIWKMKSVKKRNMHPAMFPVELPYRCIRMHTDEGDKVLDSFCGSGTTIIAAHETGRVCFGIEMMPEYVDVARMRWAEFAYEEGCDWQALTPEAT